MIGEILFYGCICRYAADSVLGVANLPMKLLMEQPVIDGYASVQGPGTVGGKVEDVSMLIYHREFFIPESLATLLNLYNESLTALFLSR